MRPGEGLKDIRRRLQITTREVEENSRKIAETEGNEEFCISNGWLTQVENNSNSTPSIHKLYSLAVIYRMKFTDLLLLYGVDLEKMGKYQHLTPLQRTYPARLEVYDKERIVSFPVRLDPGTAPERTNLLSRMVEVWGEVPIAIIQHLDIRHRMYGYIGLRDYTLYPLIRPGSFVQIDERQNKVKKLPWRTEFDRPIYFVEFRDGYACSWCELHGNRLTLIPHPLSPASVSEYVYPTEAEVVGRVTAVAMRLVDGTATGDPPRLPRRP
ncbi:MAG: hypothetical protein L0338_13150 [Acidobacteria bacterium]|nr:hypothetical protein [Acidobacteriota bacterium]